MSLSIRCLNQNLLSAASGGFGRTVVCVCDGSAGIGPWICLDNIHNKTPTHPVQRGNVSITIFVCITSEHKYANTQQTAQHRTRAQSAADTGWQADIFSHTMRPFAQPAKCQIFGRSNVVSTQSFPRSDGDASYDICVRESRDNCRIYHRTGRGRVIRPTVIAAGVTRLNYKFPHSHSCGRADRRVH